MTKCSTRHSGRLRTDDARPHCSSTSATHHGRPTPHCNTTHVLLTFSLGNCNALFSLAVSTNQINSTQLKNRLVLQRHNVASELEVLYFMAVDHFCVTFAESEPYCHSILFVCLSVGHSATYSLPRLIDHNHIWLAGIYLSSDPCKPF